MHLCDKANCFSGFVVPDTDIGLKIWLKQKEWVHEKAPLQCSQHSESDQLWFTSLLVQGGSRLTAHHTFPSAFALHSRGTDYGLIQLWQEYVWLASGKHLGVGIVNLISWEIHENSSSVFGFWFMNIWMRSVRTHQTECSCLITLHITWVMKTITGSKIMLALGWERF